MNKIIDKRRRRTASVEKQQIKTSLRPFVETAKETYLTKLRRNRVFRMRLQEYTIREICGELGASTQTICGDLKVIDAALTQTLDKKQAAKILNQKTAELEAMTQMAITGARDSNGLTRVAFVNATARYYDMQIKLLQDAGVLPKAAQKHEMSGPDEKPFTMSAPAQPAPVILNITYDKDTDRIVKQFGERPEQVKHLQAG
jgi:hypothetical protein